MQHDCLWSWRKGPTGQGMQVASRSWKRQANNISQKSVGNPADTLTLAHWDIGTLGGDYTMRVESLRIGFCSVTQSCLTLCNPMDHIMPGLPVHHQLPKFTQTHVHWIGDTIQPSHPLSSPFPTAFNLSQHRGLFKWASSLHQVAKVLEFQVQNQSFQWIIRTDFL